MTEANAFLPAFRQELNRCFAVASASLENAHRPLLPKDDLARILTLQETRILSKRNVRTCGNLTLQYDHVIYQIQTPRPSYALRQARVTVREDRQGHVTIEYRGQPLAYSIFQEQSSQAAVVSSKELNAVVTKRAKAKPRSKGHVPLPNHPWRRLKLPGSLDSP